MAQTAKEYDVVAEIEVDGRNFGSCLVGPKQNR